MSHPSIFRIERTASEKLDRNIYAANAYMDYVEKKQGNEGNIKLAFNQAGYLMTRIIQNGALTKDPAIAAAWERFLPIAIDQFKRFHAKDREDIQILCDTGEVTVAGLQAALDLAYVFAADEEEDPGRKRAYTNFRQLER